MKIKNIEKEKDSHNIYVVTLEPSWLGKLFGKKREQLRIKDTGNTFTYGGGSVYLLQNGMELLNHSKIGTAVDQWKRQW